MFEDRAAIGYDHGYDAQKFYLGLALDEKYIEGFVEGCLERIGEDDAEGEDLLRDMWEDEAEGEDLLRDMWEDEAERETVLDILKIECEVLPGRPPQW